MSRMSFSLRVDPKKVEDILNEAIFDLFEKFNNSLILSLPGIQETLKRITRKIFKSGRMYRGLVDGDLGGQFGIPEAEIRPTAEAIIDIIADNIKVDVSRVLLEARTIKGRLTISLSKQVYDDLESQDFAYVLTEKGEILPWINWSLFRGDEVIIEDYGIILRPGLGRSNQAIMIERFPPGFWRVPIDVSGTEDDNWITREVTRYRNIYQNFVTKLVDNIIRKIK